MGGLNVPPNKGSCCFFGRRRQSPARRYSPGELRAARAHAVTAIRKPDDLVPFYEYPKDQRLMEVEHLSVTFYTPRGTVRAVRDATFRIERGQVLGLVGESGLSLIHI